MPHSGQNFLNSLKKTRFLKIHLPCKEGLIIIKPQSSCIFGTIFGGAMPALRNAIYSNFSRTLTSFRQLQLVYWCKIRWPPSDGCGSFLGAKFDMLKRQMTQEQQQVHKHNILSVHLDSVHLNVSCRSPFVLCDIHIHGCISTSNESCIKLHICIFQEQRCTLDAISLKDEKDLEKNN